MKSFFKSYFSYSRRQMRGIYVLISLILLVIVFPKVFNAVKKDQVWDHSEYEESIENILQSSKEPIAIQMPVNKQLFSFNPNTVTKEELLSLGFTEKQSAIFLKYRKAGGKFNTKEDIRKVYGISDELYEKLEPFIKIPVGKEHFEPVNKRDTTYLEKKKDWNKIDRPEELIEGLKVELNSADSIDLIKIPGIGPAFAKRIISFRSFVGGFYNKEQLSEVFGFTPEILKKIEPYIEIDTLIIKKIDLNQADFKTLNKHPYIEYGQTKNLMKFKELMGKFNTVDDIVNNHLMDSASYYKIKPYLFVQ